MAELTFHQLSARLAQIEGLAPLAGGASSLTYAGSLSGRPVVVKVAPTGVAPTGHRDVLRQSRIIAALSRTPVPVPEVLWEDPGDPPEIPPLFVMSWIEGSSPEPLFDLDTAPLSSNVVAERFRRAAATMARLHRIEPTALGLPDEPIVGAADEIERWCRTLQTVDPALAPGWHDVAGALRDSVPPPAGPALVHGDFRLGNLLAERDRITAVIDWEIWSVGDPRIDAGWFLINSDPQTYRRATPYISCAPPTDELSSIYQEAVGTTMADLDWFQALACFKSVATWSLIVKHNRRRDRPDPGLEDMSRTLPHLLSRARQLLDQERGMPAS
ncbi:MULTISPECIES: phosphotransferase family protein [Mycobacterium]|uniref:Aminoglycoside phosphotransferase n=1 Tax=Mycobacterium kiyosense TaxID=2871094 RepID=A0AA37PUD1_9MYCO|nr:MULTISPECIES: phosphotransferase family protein [Mycobacterium]BDB44985.1 aminoglycoside phosphotransferase [Mycobacterium kiyosense]BDE16472.1 aminoglycoside phosphotransferase [Mycobacterium sp. 20KCMC460]GLB83355.1 aminoglycoside phosphotransferase [Mycobacterium kiyosense]GLB89687.1 aminoglycoside phosphotransferase [Mycobacterium kiyosense]GLB96832.1 aminoglycoside phosphotransferase [Mycobacterium kiyosense]